MEKAVAYIKYKGIYEYLSNRYYVRICGYDRAGLRRYGHRQSKGKGRKVAYKRSRVVCVCNFVRRSGDDAWNVRFPSQDETLVFCGIFPILALVDIALYAVGMYFLR